MTNNDYGVLLKNAHVAGLAAGNSIVPTPMNLTDGVNNYHVPEGPCGFAWVVTNEHGNGPFVKYLKNNSGRFKNHSNGSGPSYIHGDKYYYGGYYVTWVGEFGQSVEKKEAYAEAFCSVLTAAGLKCYAGSRLD